ncbi:MAG: ROK family protein [Patescibacteria group bacterium]
MRFLFDIGGSKTRVSATEDGDSFVDPVIYKTPESAEEGVEMVSEAVEKISGGEGNVEGLWGGVTGVWDKERNTLVYSPNMKGWVNKPIRELFEEKFSAPLVVGNDADVVGLGEVHYGAGRGSQICTYITISTGVGGARIVNGKIDKATAGFEPGHHIINSESLSEDGLTYEATFEGTVSGTALKKRSGMDPIEIKDPDVWEDLAFKSAIGIYNSILFWSPDTVVVGGSMVVGDPDIPIDRIRYHVERLAEFLSEVPEIKRAELGDVGGLYGAMALSKNDR